MSALDLVIAVFLILGAYSGYREGLFISIISTVAFVVALIMAFHLMDWGAEMLAKNVTELTFALPFVAFIIIFMGVILIIRGLAFLVKKTLDFTILGSMDSLAGGLLGVLKAAFVISFFIWVAASFEFNLNEDWLADSKTYSFIQPIAPVVIKGLDNYLPIFSEVISTIQQMVKTSTDGFID